MGRMLHTTEMLGGSSLHFTAWGMLSIAYVISIWTAEC